MSGIAADADYDYIIRLIQYLDRQFNIRFFISSRDFDILYRWWQKGIPLEVVQRALATVVERRQAKGKPISGFAAFSYEVKKAYRSFLSLQVGRPPDSGEPNELAQWQEFLTRLPDELRPLESEFSACLEALTNQRRPDPEPWQRLLLEAFATDDELNRKSQFFLQSLNPELRRPEIERKYRLNFLLHRFRIPLS